jgi:hypothetical protein
LVVGITVGTTVGWDAGVTVGTTVRWGASVDAISAVTWEDPDVGMDGLVSVGTTLVNCPHADKVNATIINRINTLFFIGYALLII